MLVKVLSTVLALYGGIGLVVFSLYDWQSWLQASLYFLFYITIPWLGILAVRKRSPRLGFVCITAFLLLGVRSQLIWSQFPLFAPLSLSITFGDFANGTGGMLDFFAIMLVILLVRCIYRPQFENRK